MLSQYYLITFSKTFRPVRLKLPTRPESFAHTPWTNGHRPKGIENRWPKGKAKVKGRSSRSSTQDKRKQHALKGQKLQKQHALKGQKLLAQGNALGIIAISKAPCKGKSFVYCQVF